jgi:hypothetical protein
MDHRVKPGDDAQICRPAVPLARTQRPRAREITQKYSTGQLWPWTEIDWPARPPVRPYSSVISIGRENYFFFGFVNIDCIGLVFALGAAAITFGFSFFGFFVSRLPRRSPLAMVYPSDDPDRIVSPA